MKKKTLVIYSSNHTNSKSFKMFGGEQPMPKEPKSVPKQHPTMDILNTSVTPGLYGHRAREPNTDYHVRLQHYNQRYDAIDKEKGDKEQVKEVINFCMIKFDNHALNMQSEIGFRIKVKMDAHEAAVNVRREKLKELFATEEREFVKITLETCQRGVQDKLNVMKEKSRLLKEKQDKKDEEFVQKKRLQQYMRRSIDLIPAMNKKNLRESKIIQLQQMRENEARRESERELNKMWAHLQQREALAKAEREKQELIIRYNKEKKDRDIIELQIEGKRLLKEEEKRILMEDKLELDKLVEKIRLEEIQVMEANHRKRDKICADLLRQIEIQKSFMEQRKKEEDALDNSFANLSREEYDREQRNLVSNTAVARKETMQNRQHMKELADLRQEEQKKLDELLSKYQCEINKKMDKIQCELQEARQRLQQETMKGRGQQIEEKRILAEKMLEMKQTENEWLKNILNVNDQLLAETKRLSKMATQQYRNDLNKQIDYNNLLKEREKQEMERQLEKGKVEEMKYKELVEQIIARGVSAGNQKHPFRRVLERHDCYCEPLMPKY